MNGLRDSVRKGLPPPMLLLLFLLFDVGSSWPTLYYLDEIIRWPWRTCAALLAGGLSLSLAIAGLLTLTGNKTTLNALHPDRTRTLVTQGCYRFSRNPVYSGFVGLHFATALLLGSVVGLLVTPFLILLLTILHIQVEEAGMQRLFGLQWEQYCHKTPRWFCRALFLRSFI
ncbi:isoprenylcysteine carboxylmethyltransferase family protein [Enterobacter hormaechei]|uniref:methyltransferase family protein n=2 Tax=Enterobacter TaxID=547 RepID=UPI001F1B22F8|nr:methyltransferase [Enterobacter hormaechei]UJA60592.1 isoprenylcysteine carboxylmethyltransferase family protein [Enterobacter hormaechei]HCA7802447.1 isoprenylcysteine carboxylmethyltransferase family protein [Enterobacter hormaechei]